MRRHRGITFITVLLLLAAAGGVFWLWTYGAAYWDNFEVKHILAQGANMCYRESDDSKVKEWIVNELHGVFDIKVDVRGHTETMLSITLDPEDLRIQRSEIPRKADVWITYSRPVTVPLLGQERVVTFTDHAEADLSPVKW